MGSDHSLAVAANIHKPQEDVEGRTSLARAVEAVLSDANSTEGPKERSIKESAKTEQTEEQPRTKAQGGFKPINPNRRHIMENYGREPPIMESVVKPESADQTKPVLKHLDLGSQGLPLGLVIQSAIEAAGYYQKKIGDSSGSTVIETIFKGSPIKVTANSDPIEAAVDWACHSEQMRLQEYYDYAAEELRKADEDLRKGDFREIWMSTFTFCVGVAFTWILLSMLPNLTFPEYGTRLLRLLRSVTG
jgi:hypothetical protein